jgi:predicted signal transduction protein with EAL and GGDEF domain
MAAMPIKRRLSSIVRPQIRTDSELAIYVVRVTILCGVLAVALDVINQLAFFIDWETSIRSWVISTFVASGIAAPVSFAIARAHLELYRAKLAVDELSRTDPLTGLLNRRALLGSDQEPTPQVMALVIADIDRFKTVNDTQGHMAGDEVIKMVGAQWKLSLGHSDGWAGLEARSSRWYRPRSRRRS